MVAFVVRDFPFNLADVIFKSSFCIDCRLLKPIVKPGGHICFHDFDRPSLPDVGRVAREEMENKPLMIQQVSVSELRDFSDESLQKRKEEI